MRSRANAARRTGFSAAPSDGIAPPADSRTADAFFRSPNLRRLAGRRLRPELRVASRRPRLSRQRRSSARKAAASEVKLQYKRYGTQVRTGIRRRTAASPKRTAPRFGARFFFSKPARRAKRGRRSILPSIRALLPPMRRDGFAALSRPTAQQADSARAAIYKRIRRTAILESLCFARSPRRKRNASSPRAITTGPTCNKNVYGDGSGRTAASLRQTSRPARGAGCAIFQRTGPRRFGAPTFEKSTKSLALQGFWYGAGSAAPMGRLSRRKAVLQHKRNSQRPKKEIGGSQRRDSAAILETEILCR